MTQFPPLLFFLIDSGFGVNILVKESQLILGLQMKIQDNGYFIRPITFVLHAITRCCVVVCWIYSAGISMKNNTREWQLHHLGSVPAPSLVIHLLMFCCFIYISHMTFGKEEVTGSRTWWDEMQRLMGSVCVWVCVYAPCVFDRPGDMTQEVASEWPTLTFSRHGHIGPW